MKTNHIIMVGSDNRMSATYAMLKAEGRNVSRIVTPEALNTDFRKNFDGYLVLPIPCKNASGYIKGTDILPGELLAGLSPSCHVILGSADDEIRSLCEENGFSFTDINTDESFKLKNAIPTAEAAISIAITSTEATLFSSNILVIGFGSIGKTLSRLLVSFGANVTVAARSEKDRTLAGICGCKAIHPEKIKDKASEADIIFNTVPAKLLTADVLSVTKKKVVIIDLSSRPGGCDFDYATTHNINCRMYPALPDQYSPSTSASVFYDTITGIIDSGI